MNGFSEDASPLRLGFADVHAMDFKTPPRPEWLSRTVVMDEGLAKAVCNRVTQCALDRLPQTLGEVLALFDYCGALECMASDIVTATPASVDRLDDVQRTWLESFDPAWMPAARMLRSGDLVALTVHHRDGDWVGRLGREHLEWALARP